MVVLIDEKKDGDIRQPRRKFASSKKKIALQIGIMLLVICFVGYCGRNSDGGGMIMIFLVSLLAVFLLWRQRPVWVELYEDRMRYRAFLGKEQEFFYTQMQSIDFIKKLYTVNMILPVYGYTKYAIHLEQNGKKKKLNMNSLSRNDFVMVWQTFLERGETREDKELCESMKNSYFYRKFLVPAEKLKDTYYYICKRIGIVIAVVYAVSISAEILRDLIQDIFRKSVSEAIMTAVAHALMGVVFFLFFYVPIRYFLFRKEIAEGKKVPKEVYVCDDYLKIDETEYAFDQIIDGYVISSRFHCDRMIKFTYEGKAIRYNFGKYRSFLPDYFKEYRTLELYLRGRGFKRWMQ